MAKVKKISASDGVTLDSKSKNITYEFVNNAIFNLYVDDEDVNYNFYTNFAVKSGNNLTIKTVYENTASGATKNITTTFKNFFSSNYDVEVTYVDSGVDKSVTNSMTENDLDSNHVYRDSSSEYLLAPTKNKSKTEITKVSQSVFDFKGNDTYTATVGGAAYVYDVAGNDRYKINTENANLVVKDYSGKDVYDFDKAVPIIVDNKGNDKYYLKNYDAGDYSTDYSIKDYAGNDSYELTNVVFNDYEENEIVDYKGNDKYTVKDSENQSVTDYKGSDKYNVGGKSDGVKITDGDGKDTYNIIGYNSEKPNESYIKNINITDSGEDKDVYNLKFIVNEYANGDTESRSIVDDGGNDTYNLQSTKGVRIHDVSGKDTYNLKAPIINGKKIKIDEVESIEQVFGINSETQIYDDSGDDKYNITHAINSKIVDMEGKDTYNIKGETIKVKQEISGNKVLDMTMPTVLLTEINDMSTTSNDTYNIGNMSNSLLLSSFAIKDYGGDNTFNIKNSGNYFDVQKLYELQEKAKQGEDVGAEIIALELSYPLVTINSKGNKDKYNILNSLATVIVKDEVGNDTYTFKKLIGGAVISDSDGDDTYKISKSGVDIRDTSGNDTYVIDKLVYSKNKDGGNTVVISDTSGDKDKLTVSSLKLSDIVYMANFSKSEKDGYLGDDFGLIVYDKRNGGFVELCEFYEITETTVDDTRTYAVTGFGAGNIETFKAGKTKVDLQSVSDCDWSRVETLREQVGAWLTSDGRDYNDIQQVLTTADKDTIYSLIQIFQGA